MMTEEQKRAQAVMSGCLGLWIMGIMSARAGTYNCLLQIYLGQNGCIALGMILGGAAAYIAGRWGVK